MADNLESLACAIAGFIAALKSKANPVAQMAGNRGSPRTGRERRPTTDEIYKACLGVLSVDAGKSDQHPREDASRDRRLARRDIGGTPAAQALAGRGIWKNSASELADQIRG
jgi:hypothetical protein